MTEPKSYIEQKQEVERSAQVDLLLEAPWRETLPPVLRPVAERYGRRFFTLAYNIGSVNEAIGIIHKRTGHNNELQHCVQFLVNGMNTLATISMEGVGMTPVKLAEIQLDITRAIQLAGPNVQPGGKIIVPS